MIWLAGVDADAPLVQWFWEVMEEFSNSERSLFLRFVWGRTRLPRTSQDFRGRDFVLQVLYCKLLCRYANNFSSAPIHNLILELVIKGTVNLPLSRSRPAVCRNLYLAGGK